MKGWPPTKDELFAREPGSAIVTYSKKIWDALEANPSISRMSHCDKQMLCSAILHLDSFASSAMSRLHFAPSVLGEILPPTQVAHDEAKARQWQADVHDFKCIHAAKLARDAILAGKWAEAIDATLDAGHFSRFRMAEIGWGREQSRRKAGRANKEKAAGSHAIVLRDASAIAARYASQNKKFNISSVAAEIAERHRGERGFSLRTVRATLGANRKLWQSR